MKVSAAEGEDITYYRNITVYPVSDSQGDFRGSLSFYAPSFTLINIQYNRTTKLMSFDISPENATMQGNVGVPITVTTGGRSVRAQISLMFNALQNPDWEYDNDQWSGMRTMTWENYIGTVDNYGTNYNESTTFDLSSTPDKNDIGYYWRPDPFEPKAIQLFYNYSTTVSNLDEYSKWIYTGGTSIR